MDEIRLRQHVGLGVQEAMRRALHYGANAFQTATQLREWYEFLRGMQSQEGLTTTQYLRRAKAYVNSHKNKNIAIKHKMKMKKSSKGVKTKANKSSKKTSKAQRYVDKKQNQAIKSIITKVNSNEAVHIRRNRYVASIGCNDRQVNHDSLNTINRCTSLEGAMSLFRYYNPSTPGTLTTANASTGTYTRIVNVDSVSAKLTVRNNYIVPAKIKVYLCTVRKDTNIDPVDWYSKGVADEAFTASGANSTSNPQLYLTDIRQLTEMWDIKLLKSAILQSGHQVTVSNAVGGIRYDPALYDEHALDFLKSNKAFVFVVRVEGVLGHDATVSGEYLTLKAQVDCLLDVKFVFRYEANTTLRDISTYDGSTTAFTNYGIVGMDSIADNQAFSTT